MPRRSGFKSGAKLFKGSSHKLLSEVNLTSERCFRPMKKAFLFLLSHGIVGLLGFALGIYLLPVLTSPAAPLETKIQALQDQATFSAKFVRSLDGSDLFHWGEGDVFIGARGVALRGEIAPGPDYRVYLSPKFVENEAQVLAVKDQMIQVGEVKTFENFVVDFPEGINIADYNTVLVWCEAFSEFITAAKYR